MPKDAEDILDFVWDYRWYVAVAVGVILAAGMIYAVIRRASSGRRTIARVENADQCRSGNPTKAAEIYRRVIHELEGYSRAHKLDKSVAEALGRAYLGDCILLAAAGDKSGALKRFHQASRYPSAQVSQAAAAVAWLCLNQSDVSDEAMVVYLAALRAPSDQMPTDLALGIVKLLEPVCRIDPNTPPARIGTKMALNASLASLPGPPPVLVVIEGPDAGKQFPIVENTTIGRGPSNSAVLNDSSVSKQHARIVSSGGRLAMADLQSRTGTFLDGMKVTSSRTVIDGAMLGLGQTKMAVYLKPRPLTRPVQWAHKNLGAGHLMLKSLGPASLSLARAVKLDPNDAKARCLLGQTHSAMGNYAAAVAELTRVLELDPEESEVASAWSEAAVRSLETGWGSEDPAERERLLEETIQRLRRLAAGPDNSEACQYNLARACAMAGRTEEAIEAIRSAIAKNTRRLAYYVLLAQWARQIGQRDLAFQSIRRALKLDPQHLEANLIYGELCFGSGDYAKASKHLEWVQDAEIGQGAPHFSATDDFKYRLGRALYETGRYIPASRLLAEAAKTSREAMFYGGRCHSQTGRFQSAAQIFRGMIQRHGDSPEGRYFLASTLGNLQMYDKALSVLEGSPKDPLWADRQVSLSARLLMRLGRIDEATQRLSTTGGPSADSDCVRFERGRLAFILGDWARAEAQFAAVLRQNQSDILAKSWVARALLAQGRQEEAEGYLESVLESPNEVDSAILADTHFSLGRIRRRQNRLKESVEHFGAARQSGCNDDQLAFERAMACAEMGQLPESLAELSSLATRYGDDPTVAANLAAVSCRIAQDHAKFRRYEQAVPILQQAVEYYRQLGLPKPLAEASDALADTSFLLGARMVLTGDGKLDEGIRALEMARALRTTDRSSGYFLAAAYFRKGNYDRSTALLKDLAEHAEAEPTVRSALALSLERSGQPAEAQEVWERLVCQDHGSPLQRAKYRLGLAGLCARQKQFRKTAELLCQVLEDGAPCPPEMAENIGKLAASYLSMVGDPTAAERVIREHLKDTSPGATHAYLGAVLAQQGRLEDALEALRQAIASDPADPVRELYEIVVRAVVAKQVLAGNLDGAYKQFKQLQKGTHELSPATASFMAALEAGIMIPSGEHLSEGVAEAYRKAHAASSQNSKILRNYAIVCHRLAIQFEEAGQTKKADRYWKQSSTLWIDMATRGPAFWEQHLDAYNRSRHRRSRVQVSELEQVIKRLIGLLAEIHVCYAVSYARETDRLDDCRRHVGHACAFDDGSEFRKSLAKRIVEESIRLHRTRTERMLKVVTFILQDVTPGDKEYREMASSLHMEVACEALWKENISGFKSHMSEVARRYEGKGDLRKMASAASGMDTSFIRTIIRSAKNTVFSGIAAQVPEERQKNLLLQIVLQLCALADSLPSWQRSQVEAQMPVLILRLVMELVKS